MAYPFPEPSMVYKKIKSGIPKPAARGGVAHFSKFRKEFLELRKIVCGYVLYDQ